MFRKKFRIERTEKRMAFNPMKLMELKNLRDRFAQNHPKFVKFMGDLASSQIEEGTILEVTVKKPDGRTMVSNIKVTASDLEMLQAIQQLYHVFRNKKPFSFRHAHSRRCGEESGFLSISVSTRAITESHFPLCLFIIEQTAGKEMLSKRNTISPPAAFENCILRDYSRTVAGRRRQNGWRC